MKNIYKHSKNLCTKAIRQAKNKFFYNKLTLGKNDPKHKWKVLNSILQNKSNTNPIPDILYNNLTINNDLDKANKFNSEFSSGIIYTLLSSCFSDYDNTVKLLQSDLDNFITDPSNFNSNSLDKFSFLYTTQHEIYSQILKLKNKSNNSDSYISNSFLKVINSKFSIIFAYITNLIYTNSIFPKSLKTAIVFPKFKTGNKHIITNYRPITTISNIAKILEKNMLLRLSKFTDFNNLIHTHQYAYQPNKNILDAIIKKTDLYTPILTNPNLY